jgi:hypothetical protein
VEGPLNLSGIAHEAEGAVCRRGVIDTGFALSLTSAFSSCWLATGWLASTTALLAPSGAGDVGEGDGAQGGAGNVGVVRALLVGGMVGVRMVGCGVGTTGSSSSLSAGITWIAGRAGGGGSVRTSVVGVGAWVVGTLRDGAGTAGTLRNGAGTAGAVLSVLS